MTTQWNIYIKDMNDGLIWSDGGSYGDFTHAQLHVDKWLKEYGQSKPGLGVLEGLMVTRIDSLENFAKDFFFPTVVHFAFRVKNIVERIFACLFAVILDIVSFPVRFIALPIRVVHNLLKSTDPHPLETLIRTSRSKEQIAKVLRVGMVSLQYTIKKENQPTKTYNQWIAFKSLPGG